MYNYNLLYIKCILVFFMDYWSPIKKKKKLICFLACVPALKVQRIQFINSLSIHKALQITCRFYRKHTGFANGHMLIHVGTYSCASIPKRFIFFSEQRILATITTYSQVSISKKIIMILNICTTQIINTAFRNYWNKWSDWMTGKKN
jgi:hypothetical protein